MKQRPPLLFEPESRDEAAILDVVLKPDTSVGERHDLLVTLRRAALRAHPLDEHRLLAELLPPQATPAQRERALLIIRRALAE